MVLLSELLLWVLLSVSVLCSSLSGMFSLYFLFLPLLRVVFVPSSSSSSLYSSSSSSSSSSLLIFSSFLSFSQHSVLICVSGDDSDNADVGVGMYSIAGDDLRLLNLVYE